jgi:hypothetical protein
VRPNCRKRWKSWIHYEGDWKGGLRHGQGDLTDVMSGVVYKGGWVADLQEGPKSTVLKLVGDKMEAEFRRGFPIRKCTTTLFSGDVYYCDAPPPGTAIDFGTGGSGKNEGGIDAVSGDNQIQWKDANGVTQSFAFNGAPSDKPDKADPATDGPASNDQPAQPDPDPTPATD